MFWTPLKQYLFRSSESPPDNEASVADQQVDLPTADGPLFGPDASLGPTDLQLALDDGTLVATGPRGDPVGPSVIAAVAAEDPDARLPLQGIGTSVRAARAAAVLDAQKQARLAPGEKAEAWLLAMLGSGPEPDMAAPAELHEEQRDAASGAGPALSGEQDIRAGFDDIGEAQPSLQEREPVALEVELSGPTERERRTVALVLISNVPLGSVLSAGVDQGDGSWLLGPHELAALTLEPAADCPSEFTLKVTAVSVTSRAGDLSEASHELAVRLAPVMAPPGGAVAAAPRQVAGPIALELDAGTVRQAGLDAIVVRNLPSDARLSAGRYESSIEGWILRPGEMAELCVIPGETSEGPMDLVVMGVKCRDGRGDIRTLARVSVAID
ncbi:MAG: hypothetical protein ACREH6_13375 [Geminicoccaceae bacterium]